MKPKSIKQMVKELGLKSKPKEKPKKKFNEIIRKDKNGNIIYRKYPDGYEYWKEFDKNDNEIHYKSSDGDEYWYEYDSNNNLIDMLKKYSDGSYELNGKQMVKKK